jgi:3-oxoacyl-[acyl-carrier protein] reductase
MTAVIVTGGSRGLGLAIAHKLAHAGYRVIAIARGTSDQFAAAARDAPPDALQLVPFDLSQVDRIPELVKTLRGTFGPIAGLVNNAGIGTSGVLATMAIADIEALVRLNTLSPIILTKHVVRSMMSKGGGRIVNVSSVVAFSGYSGLSVYSATKASLVGFTRSLAREVGQFGITVNAVAPGFVDTEMTAELDDGHRATLTRRSALRRLPEAADVANAVEFLMDERSRNITGTVLTVDAGSTA